MPIVVAHPGQPTEDRLHLTNAEAEWLLEEGLVLRRYPNRIDSTDVHLVPITPATLDLLRRQLDTAEAKTTINMDNVVAVLRDRGYDAYVEQTGGCATIFAGDQLTIDEADGYARWSAKAGPGWFEAPSWTFARASTAEFYVGYDTEDAEFVITVETNDTTYIADLLELVIHEDRARRAAA